jgi:hypothetical protein
MESLSLSLKVGLDIPIDLDVDPISVGGPRKNVFVAYTPAK